MLKLVNVDSTDFTDESSITVLDLSGPLEKKAATAEIENFVSTLQPVPGYTYLHVLAMTAGEWYSSNRNGDYFPEETLKLYHKTFETNPAHLFRGHVNKDKNKAYGVVIFSAYNDNMHRVEFIIKAKNELVEDINRRIKSGDFPSTSMALRIPYDVCSICGNKAHSRQEYCTHLRTQLNKLYPDGRKVFALNNTSFSGFDLSIVVRPADPNSSILTKIADAETIGSAELAEMEGLTESSIYKQASLKKLSELIKEITDDCYIVGSSTIPRDLLGKGAPQDLPLESIEYLHHFDLSQTLSAMASMGISPSVSFLAELITRKKLGQGYGGIGEIVQSFLNEVPSDVNIPMIKFEEVHDHNPLILKVLAPFLGTSSMLPSEIEKRASNIGYSGNGPHIEPTYEEEMARQSVVKAMPEESINYSKLLLTIGGLALLSKYFITSQIEKKLREIEHSPKNNVKIVIVKKASDYLVTTQLAKLAMVQSLPMIAKQKDQSTDGSLESAKLGMSVTKRILRNTRTKLGGKLVNLITALSLGHKLTTLG